jgi:hypothetical protein
MIYVYFWYLIFLVLAILFEIFIKIFSSLIVLFKISLRPASLFSLIINWIGFVIIDAAYCPLVICALNSSICKRRLLLFSKWLGWTG